VREVVGLTAYQAQIVAHYRAALETLDHPRALGCPPDPDGAANERRRADQGAGLEGVPLATDRNARRRPRGGHRRHRCQQAWRAR
jgi:uncharacterized protein RhaS with RHS repeats